MDRRSPGRIHRGGREIGIRPCNRASWELLDGSPSLHSVSVSFSLSQSLSFLPSFFPVFLCIFSPLLSDSPRLLVPTLLSITSGLVLDHRRATSCPQSCITTQLQCHTFCLTALALNLRFQETLRGPAWNRCPLSAPSAVGRQTEVRWLAGCIIQGVNRTGSLRKGRGWERKEAYIRPRGLYCSR